MNDSRCSDDVPLNCLRDLDFLIVIDSDCLSSRRRVSQSGATYKSHES